MELNHIDEKGNARMVDVSQKGINKRVAVAAGKVYMKPGTISLIIDGNVPKGDVLATARIAGIMASKHTQDLVPMCHNVPLDAVSVDLKCDSENNCIDISASVSCNWKTGVEMEALCAVSIAALTIYDMCKAVDKDMVIGDIKLISKTGGKSGDYIRGGKING